MKAATLSDIKRELKSKDQEEIMALCLRLGRFKKDNKELLTYLLFESDDEATYVMSIKESIDEGFQMLNVNTLYHAKKGLSKMLRNLTKMIRYSGNKQTEVEVLIHFCQAIKDSPIDIRKSTVLNNLFERQIVKIKKALSGLHEDLQADYQYEIDRFR